MESSRRVVERIGRISDDVVRLGPLRLGWDAVLEFIPGVGEIYSVGAGVWLLRAGHRAHVPAAAMTQVAALVGLNTAIGAFNVVPVAGWLGSVAAGLFRGHRYAAKTLARAIDETLYVEGPRTPAREQEVEGERRREGKRRVVWLEGALESYAAPVNGTAATGPQGPPR